MTFRATSTHALAERPLPVAVGLAPRIDHMPVDLLLYDDPFLPFGRAVIDATADLVPAYVFHLGAYLALGAAGAIALERTLAYVPRPAIKILHAAFATADYVKASYEDAFGADAVTVSAALQPADLAVYLADSAHGVLIESDTAQGDEALAHLPYSDQLGRYQVWHEGGVISLNESPPLRWIWGARLLPTRLATWRDDLRTALSNSLSKPDRPAAD